MSVDLCYLSLTNTGRVHRNLPTPALYEEAIRRREGVIAHLGSLVTRTGQYTGRSPQDRFIVREPTTENLIWWGKDNQAFAEDAFARLHARLAAYLQGKDLFVQDCYAGADPDYRLRLRVVTETAWHSLFARNMFVRELDAGRLENFEPDFTVLSAPGFRAIPELDGTHSEAFVLVHFARKLVVIGGTSYAGEMKKSVFSILNFLLPQKQVLGMHCAANVGRQGDVAVFFGLSGTGKTTLSTDPDRALVGDDEHGWSDKGVFNFEGGCYAKVIRLSEQAEPEIYGATRMFGTILENVSIDFTTRQVDLEDAGLTENTRASYPISHIPHALRSGMAGQPKQIIMLTCDAFGVLPPIAKLTPEQAMYHFMSGYTAKIAGTERGVKEPQATFSACFGSPFMTLHPTVYARMLGEKVRKHAAACWLVNTGWSGGPYGIGGRIKITHTRAMVRAALTGALDSVDMAPDPVFRFLVPKSCPGVPSGLLNPASTWPAEKAYWAKAAELAQMFKRNFSSYTDSVSREVAEAGPEVVWDYAGSEGFLATGTT